MTSIDANAASREAVLARVRKALGRNGPDAQARAAADAYVAAHAQGPRPRMPANLVERFVSRANDMASTVERIGHVADVPVAVSRYLDQITPQPAPRAGVCWPEFADLDWRSAGLAIEARPTQGHDALGVTGCFCGIAETGTLVFVTGRDTTTGSMLLPSTHIAVVRAARIVSGMEEAFALIRSELPAMPRAVNLVSGPSRTGDIEQTIVLGAHGPYRVHLLVVG